MSISTVAQVSELALLKNLYAKGIVGQEETLKNYHIAAKGMKEKKKDFEGQFTLRKPFLNVSTSLSGSGPHVTHIIQVLDLKYPILQDVKDLLKSVMPVQFTLTRVGIDDIWYLARTGYLGLDPC
ncbi:unnamed protein product [Caretta caretta]